eukprot:jgi/Mesen1/7095/ME000369S06422
MGCFHSKEAGGPRRVEEAHDACEVVNDDVVKKNVQFEPLAEASYEKQDFPVSEPHPEASVIYTVESLKSHIEQLDTVHSLGRVRTYPMTSTEEIYSRLSIDEPREASLPQAEDVQESLLSRNQSSSHPLDVMRFRHSRSFRADSEDAASFATSLKRRNSLSLNDSEQTPATSPIPFSKGVERGASYNSAGCEGSAKSQSSDGDDSNDGIDEMFYPFGVGPMRPVAGSPFSQVGAPLPSNEAFRLQVLKAYHVLDTDPEPKFDRLTSLASQTFKTPVALVSLVDKERQFFKSPCLVVENALEDSRFSQNKLVMGAPHIRFYAGAPLVTSAGFILGALCIIDFVPHKFGKMEEELLMSIAQLVVMVRLLSWHSLIGSGPHPHCEPHPPAARARAPLMAHVASS